MYTYIQTQVCIDTSFLYLYTFSLVRLLVMESFISLAASLFTDQHPQAHLSFFYMIDTFRSSRKMTRFLKA